MDNVQNYDKSYVVLLSFLPLFKFVFLVVEILLVFLSVFYGVRFCFNKRFAMGSNCVDIVLF
jgi:hypothetical protein